MLPSASSGRVEDVGGSSEVASDGGEVGLQAGFSEPSPSHAVEAIAAFPGSEDLLDPAAHP